jgi:hypothetical protein
MYPNNTVNDTTPPEIICPDSASFQCNNDLPLAYSTYAEFLAAGGLATDLCGIDTSTFTVTETDLGSCPRIVTRIYSVADSCGNTSQCLQTITVNDTIPPVINCPPDTSFECLIDVPPVFTNYLQFTIGGGSASDNCALDTSTFFLGAG